MCQGAREQALRAFRNGKVDVLVATDVAARGIDVENVTHVVNFQCPEDEKTYLHRIGRTGRAGNTGVAVTFVDWEDLTRWSVINKALDLGIPEPTETYSSSDNLYADLGIPREAKGRLPKAAQTRAGLDAEVLEDIEGPQKQRSGGSRSGGSKSGGSTSGGTRSGTGRSGSRSGGRGRSQGAESHGGDSGPSSDNTDGASREGSGSDSLRRNRNRRRTRAGQSAAE